MKLFIAETIKDGNTFKIIIPAKISGLKILWLIVITKQHFTNINLPYGIIFLKIFNKTRSLTIS